MNNQLPILVTGGNLKAEGNLFLLQNNDFQYETGSQKGELLSSVFFDQIPEMEVK